MFNTIDNSSKTSFNTPASGIIQKSNAKSFFLILPQSCGHCIDIFSENSEYKSKRVVVLQTMLSNNNNLLIELIYEKDFANSVMS